MTIKILLAGEGGQGIQTVAKLISQACFEAGFYVSEIPNFGLEQRGGVSLEYLIISDKKIIYPKFTYADIILVMSSQAKERLILSLRGTMLGVTKQSRIILDLNDFMETLQNNNIHQQSYNIFFLGLIGKTLSDKKLLNIKNLQKLLENKLNKKPNWKENNEAFVFGCNYII